MQLFTIIGRVLLAALAVTAAKLPLPPQLSTLYEAPLADLPVPAQSSVLPVELPQVTTGIHQSPAVNSQVPAVAPQAPAELSTLYEAPLADLPSQSSGQVQSSGLLAAAHQGGIVQVQSTSSDISAPAVPSANLGLPSQTFSVPSQQPFPSINVVSVQSPTHPQPTFTQTSQQNILVSSDQSVQHATSTATGPVSSVAIIPQPVAPSTLYETPSEENLTPIPQPSSFPATAVNIPVPNQPTILKPATAGQVGQAQIHSSSEQVIPFSNEQNVLVNSHDNFIPVPNEPSTLYGVPDQDFQLTPQVSQTVGTVLPEQNVPVSHFGTSSNIPTGIIIEEISNSRVPAEPSGLYETPESAFPVQADTTLSLTQSDTILSNDEGFFPVQSTSQVNVPTVGQFQGSGQAILFPVQEPSVIVPVPSIPSSLYETPLPSVPSTLYEVPVQPGKTMTSEDNHQNILQEPTSLYEVPAASEQINSVAKQGGMMKGMPYNFQWGVDDEETGAMFTHVENSDGKRTSGQYRVTLPDGRIQVVNFYDNGDGFHADISYE